MDEKEYQNRSSSRPNILKKVLHWNNAVLKIIGIDKFPQNEVSGFIVFHVKIQHV